MSTHLMAHGSDLLAAQVNQDSIGGILRWTGGIMGREDASAVLISLSLILGYHLYLRLRLRHDSAYTIQSINKQARTSWVQSLMDRPGQEVLAVQTLRNSTMAATFLASTAILLIMGVLNLMQQTDLGDSLLSSLHDGQAQIRLGHLKLLALLVDFFWAFFCFSQALRMYNHVGYLINAGPNRNPTISPSYVARLLNRSGHYYSLGMRSYYVSVPLVFWLFGSYALLLSSVALVVVLYHIDRSPEVDDEDGRSEETGGERLHQEGARVTNLFGKVSR
ncbi:DUF599 domain-containing protein [Imhoffiella purpurea]|uniref:DUF599 domain-containing protein n=1 Tax=Imhoffiella purpurea TaxID=1249627 RepID=W9VKF7_9GAMM|nr:DUF599 domain-containing protein [Imhoffiella purpurea]EXJ16567.1 hypothetical protein D779_4120 [Imhoffiella purpurea]